ncbi:acetate--CoA ligase family protein [uncultured Bradyrhizobium sp.]|uniref:acetate--CoA ligase family protein n=1 Tax=uncultured Bradyrhizobium sp. TaxID=199684 RepID=UPI00261F9F35|nr:acetate--CoA ligase family protein [uncultured Bradyrhizobium sp.]
MTNPREKTARLMAATRIAVVGASSDPTKLTGRPIAYMLQRGFKGEIIPINPSRAEIQGLRAYPSLAAVDRPVDLALIGTAAAQVEPIIAEGISAGIKSFVVLSSGFSEHDAEGARLQTRLTELARCHDVAIVGPNCLGVINAETGLIASFTTAMEENALTSGGFGFASQSGALGAYWLDLVLQAGLGVSRWISTGNECDVDLAASIGMLVDDPLTKVIGAYVEDVKDGPAFRAALRDAAHANKPVFVIKAGRSQAGAAAAASHTGAMAGEDRVYQACFDQYGAVRVASVTEMIDAAKLVLHDAVPAAGKIGVLSVSGGAGVMLADAIESAGLGFPAFTAQTAEALSKTLPGYSKPHNPVDLTANVLANTEMFRKTLSVVSATPELDACILFIGLMHSISDVLTESILAARAASGRPFIVVWIGARPDIVAKLDAARIPVYPDIPQAIAALAHASRARAQRSRAALAGDAPERARAAGRSRTVTEWQSKARLREIGGVALPAGAMVSAGHEVAAAIAALKGPFVAKLQSPAMPHKSEHGGVVLGLADASAVTEAVRTLQQRGREAQVECDGVLIEQMVGFDIELIVGFRRDPVFGPMLMVGRGGIEVELDPDIAIALLPLSAEEIEALLRSLRSARLFDGFRGRQPVELGAIAQALAKIGAGFLADPGLEEIEINPRVARGSNVVALDALMKVANP